MSRVLPTFDDVRAAAQRLHGHAHRTPVLTSRTADARSGAQVFFKCENLQRMGAFKFRGAYNALAHRHEREMRGILGAAAPNGQEPDVEFVPHSGPFVRGIHATVRMTMKSGTTAEAAARIAADAYEGSPFVRVGTSPPKLTEVVATNRVRLGIAVRGRTLVVTSVIDNLTKGAAGGGIQWMNRVLGLPESTGLLIPGPGWI